MKSLVTNLLDTKEFKIETDKSVDELLSLPKKLHEAEDEIFDLDLSFEERRAKRQDVINIFLEKLLEKKDQFKYVFKTASGSIYFVSDKEKCWRLKAIDNSYKAQPVLAKVIFVSQEQANKIIDLLNGHFFQEEIINYKIDMIDFGLNVVPIEFGIEGFPEIVFKEDGESFTVLGTKLKEQEYVEPSFASGIHVGHPITEIIKS